jgi:hypothetical protein
MGWMIASLALMAFALWLGQQTIPDKSKPEDKPKEKETGPQRFEPKRRPFV